MKNAYMQWFYGKIHNFKLANILANILYGLQILKYKIEIRKLGNQKKLLEYFPLYHFVYVSLAQT